MKKLFVLLMMIGLHCVLFAVPVTDGLIVHLDARSLIGLHNGDEVTVWADLATGDLVDGTVSAVSTGPTYVADGFNGNAVVRMAEGEYMASGSITLPNVNDGLTVFVVATGDASGAAGERVMQFGLVGSSNAGKCLAVDFSTNKTDADGGSGGRFNNGKALARANNPLTTGFHIAAMQIDQGEQYGAFRYYVDDMNPETLDNVANSTNTLGLIAANNELTVGTGVNTNGLGYMTSDLYKGDIAEILVYNRQLTQAQMQDMFDYLDAKYTIFQAWNPAPADAAISQGAINGDNVDVNFAWNTGVDPDDTAAPNPDITKHYFYINKGEPNFVNVTPQEISAGSPTQSMASVGPLALDFDATYYWRVDEGINNSAANDPNTLTGPVWSFDTLASVPVIDEQPAHTAAFTTDASVSISTSVTSITTASYEWKKSIDNANDTPADDVTVGQNSATLTISSPAPGDEAYYYCIITNDGGQAVTEPAFLTIKRQVLNWAFESNFVDSSGEGHDAVVNSMSDPNNPTFSTDVPGAVGSYSAYFDGIKQKLTTAALDPNTNNYLSGFTVSMWVKPEALPQPNFAGLFNNNNGGPQDFQLEILNGTNYSYRGGATQTFGTATTDWVHIAVVCDGTSTDLYRNLEGDDKVVANVADNVFGIFQVGCNRAEDVFFNGYIDDVKVWNYPLTFGELAADYWVVTGHGACLSHPTYDFNGDCLVNLNDFAAFAADWLNCGLYPQSECGN